MTNHKTYKQCVLPESALFHLDDNGVCSLCNSPTLSKHILKKPDAEKLIQIIDSIRKNGIGREFDCIVAWSGGRDSTFMLHELVTRYNTLGQQVAKLVQGEQEAGYHEVRFDGSDLSTGVYFCRLKAGDFAQTLKLVLLR